MHFEEAVSGNTALAEDALPGERYVATNRFKVRNNAGPKFEKRWADRKSRLAELEGFRFFALLKRVSAFGVDYAEEGDFGNYISMTVSVESIKIVTVYCVWMMLMIMVCTLSPSLLWPCVEGVGQ